MIEPHAILDNFGRKSVVLVHRFNGFHTRILPDWLLTFQYRRKVIRVGPVYDNYTLAFSADV